MHHWRPCDDLKLEGLGGKYYAVLPLHWIVSNLQMRELLARQLNLLYVGLRSD
jgi:hypothetical protein